MKVYFCNSLLETCHYVRCLQPMIAGGWDGDKWSLREERSAPPQMAKATLAADIVVFHRPGDDRSLKVAKLIKGAGKKIVMDNDDTYKGLDRQKMGKFFGEIDDALDEFCEFADLITVSTEFLAQEYRKINPNVIVLPNCVDPDDWPEPLRNEGKKVRIGLTGSVALNGDFDGFVPAMKELAKRDDVQIVLFALPPKISETKKVQRLYKEDYDFWFSLPIEWQPFVKMADYFDTLNNLKLDIMVIPRKDDYFNRCKSNIKFLEAAMLEIPVVAQGFPDGLSPYEVNPEDAKHMTIIKDNDLWLPKVLELVQNKTLRRNQGKLAREYVLANYDIHEKVELWEKTYKNLLEGKNQVKLSKEVHAEQKAA